MPELIKIDVNNRLNHSEDFYFLKKQAIDIIEGLSGRTWSDFNTHDPGITLLEALCYAITELGYKTSLEIKDIVASGNALNKDNDLYSAREILPCNPVTLTDFRKLIVDVKGIKNAWIELSNESEVPVFIEEDGNSEDGANKYKLTYNAERALQMLEFRGLYKVYVEFEDNVRFEEQKDNLVATINQKLQFHRNICEDFVGITSVEYEPFTIDAMLRVSEGADIERINAKVYKVIHDFISPGIKFYTLEQMLLKGYSEEEIFEGPVLKHGFIDKRELENSERNKQIHVSDIINLILNIEGVIAIIDFSLPANETSFSDFNDWLDDVYSNQKKPRLDVEGSSIAFARSGDRHRKEADKYPDKRKVMALFSFMQNADSGTKLKSYTKDIVLPPASMVDLASYYPVQQTLPIIYGMKEKIIDERVDEAVVKNALDEIKDAAAGKGFLSDKTISLDAIARTTFKKPLSEMNSYEEISDLKAAYAMQQMEQLDKRKRLALQLRGFLMFFEQMLADYSQDLENIKSLLSFDVGVDVKQGKSVFSDINDFEMLFLNMKEYNNSHTTMVEPAKGYYYKRTKILNHLLARFGEVMYLISDAPNPAFAGDDEQLPTNDKTAFLKDYIQVSNYRGKGFEYNVPDVWDSNNVEGLKKRICRLTGIKDYSRRFIAPDNVFVEERELQNNIKRYEVVVLDPENKEEELLRSESYEFESEAYETLNYIMENGANSKLYDTEGKKGNSHYSLLRLSQENEYEVVASAKFDDKKDMDALLKKTIKFFNTVSRDENFHVLEHLLLRPRIGERKSSSKKKAEVVESDAVALLPVLEIDPGLSLSKKEDDVLRYRFKIVEVQKKDKSQSKQWNLQLINSETDDVVLTIRDSFSYYKHALERIAHIKKAAADQENYDNEINADGYHLFRIVENNTVLAHSKQRFQKKEEMEELTNELVNFFSYELPEEEREDEEEETDIASLLDPYSFQVSILLPSWHARFRDISFRHLLEKAIFLESPAHISPVIYWLDHRQMRVFENAYHLWIKEQAENEIPNAQIVSNLVYVLNKLNEES